MAGVADLRRDCWEMAGMLRGVSACVWRGARAGAMRVTRSSAVTKVGPAVKPCGVSAQRFPRRRWAGPAMTDIRAAAMPAEASPGGRPEGSAGCAGGGAGRAERVP